MAGSTATQTDLSPFARQLAARIGRDGPLTVADFMAAAAGEYYATQKVFGRQGDFTTAPEISQLFGEMIAAWLTDLWLQMGRPDHLQLVELGPGRGTLSADIMRTLQNWPDFKTAISLHLVENSPALREQQARALAAYKPAWYDRIEDVPQGLCVFIANEFLDALPVHQFEKAGGVWRERRVGFDKRFFFTLADAELPLETVMPASFLDAPDGSVFEISPASLTVVGHIAARLQRCGGAALIVDYGHMRAGLGDTLQALENHAYASVLENVGGRDITAHVDFATCAEAAAGCAAVHGPVTQAEFLLRLGILQRAQSLYSKASPEDAKEVQAGLARLIGGAEMGSLFKVMALTPQASAVTPAGFQGEDTQDG